MKIRFALLFLWLTLSAAGALGARRSEPARAKANYARQQEHRDLGARPQRPLR